MPIASLPTPSLLTPLVASPQGSSLVTSFTLYNSGSSAVSGQPVTLDVPLASGDIAGGSKIQVRANDGMTILATQEDSCSKWSQDGSRASCAVSFIEPDVIVPGATAT
ncbi:MAG: hypothetical protein JF604_02465, partial [Bradyrhizobium sp.]|nr:hypothetical protein [Bradyrhizobium sp.]